MTRQVLFAIGRVAEMDEVKDGVTWLKTEVPGYWDQRLTAIVPSSIIWAESIRITGGGMPTGAALARTVENDHV